MASWFRDLPKCPEVQTVVTTVIATIAPPQPDTHSGSSTSMPTSTFIHHSSSSTTSLTQPPNTTALSEYSTVVRLLDRSLDYPSTLIVIAILSITCLCFALVILRSFDGISTGKHLQSVLKGAVVGFFRFAPAASAAAPSPGAATSASTRFVGDLQNAHAATNNSHWAFFFAVSFLFYAVMALLLDEDRIDLNNEGNRILVFVVRLLRGASCVVLTTALNFHRIYRHRDYLKVSTNNSAIERQVHRMNQILAAFYLVFCVAAFIASHVVDMSLASVQDSFLYVAVVVDVLLNSMGLFAGLWVVLHRGEWRPARRDSVILCLGLGLRLIAELPQPLWNDKVFGSWPMRVPCPAVVMSAYDFVILLSLAAHIMLMMFVVREHRRTEVFERNLLRDKLAGDLDDMSSDSAMSFTMEPQLTRGESALR